MKCKKICKKHDEFWHTWATNEKKQMLENLQILDKSKKITKELKKIIKVRPKKIQKPLVSDAERRKRRTDNERIRRANLRKTNPIWHELQKKKQKDYYRKNPEIQIRSSTKWNQANKERKNANNRASYRRTHKK